MSRPPDDQLLELYEEWDPEEETVVEFCDRNAVTKDTLYNLMHKRGVVPKSRRPDAKTITLTEIAERLERIETLLRRRS